MTYVSPADWTGPLHERPGLFAPRAHQVKPADGATGIGVPPIVGRLGPTLAPEDWPGGLAQLVGDGQLAPGWWYRVLHAVGPMERSASTTGPAAGPRRWVTVESVSLRLRGDVDEHGRVHTGAVVVWHRPIVDLRKRASGQTPWSIAMCKTWPLTPDWLPADTPRDLSVAELKVMIRKG